MDYKTLGNTGTIVSELCLGTMTFGWTTGQEDAFKIMDKFMEAGGNFIDTANVYQNGKSESVLGEWLNKMNRDDFVIATKVRFGMGSSKNDMGLGRKHILNSVKKSLERLKTDYIDLLQIHAWDPITPLDETLSTLQNLVDDGVIRYYGASNLRAWQFEKSNGICLSRGYDGFKSIQPQYNLLCRSTENELIPMAVEDNIAVLPWSPLKGGILSGKYKKEMKEPPENTRQGDAVKQGRRTMWEQVQENEVAWKVVEQLEKLGMEIGKSPSQIALRWLLQRRGVTSPILGVRTISQLEDNLGSVGWKLKESDMKSLNEVSKIYATYPYDLGAENKQRSGRLENLTELP